MTMSSEPSTIQLRIAEASIISRRITEQYTSKTNTTYESQRTNIASVFLRRLGEQVDQKTALAPRRRLGGYGEQGGQFCPGA
jgi:hypothetical protein